MPAMKRFCMYLAVGLLTFVLGVASYIHFAFGFSIIFADTPKLTLPAPPAPEYHCTGDIAPGIHAATPRRSGAVTGVKHYEVVAPGD